MKKLYSLVRTAGVFLFLLLANLGILHSQTIVYVTTDGAGDGSSWAQATNDIQAAINAAAAGTHIWIKAGTYSTPGDSSFTLKEEVSLYGGFAGTETSVDERTGFRPGGANETILSGGNAHRVIAGTDITSATVFSGITVKDGNNTSETYTTGGGMRLNGGNMIIEKSAFINNTGAGNAGGLYMFNAATPTVSDCIFAGNQSAARGGATYTATGCDAIFTNCIFENNSAETDGGAVRVYQSSPSFINCTFVRNALTEGDGAAVDISTSSTVLIINCAFWGNIKAGVTDDDLSLASSSAAATVTNCAFEGTINPYSGSTLTETGTVDISSTNPQFTLPSSAAGAANYNPAADWTLQAGSPLIDAGTASGASLLDIMGLLRDASPDIGAYEYGGVVPYLITVETTGEGTVDPDMAYVAPGADQAFLLTPGAGYEITALTYNGSDVLASLTDNGNGSFTYTALAVAADGVLAVSFEPLPVKYTLTITAGPNGSISPSGDIQVSVTDETVFTITPDAGFVIETLELNGNSVLEDTVDNNDGTFTYTLTGVGENSTLHVTFTAIYTVTVTAGTNGTIDPSGDILMTANDVQDFLISPNVGYQVETFTLNGADAMADLVNNGDGTYSYTLSGVDANTTISVTFSAFQAKVTYVKAGGTGDGSSWTNAAGNLQDVIFASNFGDEIWVAKGIYLTPGEVVDSSFTLKDGVSLYGGFAGTETSKDQRTAFRMGQTNETKLSADLDGNGFLTGGNGQRVVFGEFLSAYTIIDGFTINGGFSEVEGSNGAGMKLRASSPHILNCTFYDNYSEDGSGLYLYRSGDVSSNPVVENCFFIKNFAFDDGGAVYNASGTLAKFINCVFANNYANDEGGAIRNYECSPEFYNCTFVYNALPDVDPGGGGTYGPAVRNYQTSTPYMNTEPKFINCAFWKNQDGSDIQTYDISNTGGMADAGAFATVTNCALDLVSSSSCIVTDTVHIGPIGDVFTNPGFKDISGSPGYQGYSAAADWDLVAGSKLIDRGTGTPEDVPEYDIRGAERTGNPDIGAYEYLEGNAVPGTGMERHAVEIYPNPSSGLLFVKTGELNITGVTLIDITGRSVYTAGFNGNENLVVVDISARPNGIYFLKVVTADGLTTTRKIIRR